MPNCDFCGKSAGLMTTLYKIQGGYSACGKCYNELENLKQGKDSHYFEGESLKLAQDYLAGKYTPEAAEKQAKEEQAKEDEERESQELKSNFDEALKKYGSIKPKKFISLNGSRGRKLDLYEDRIVITTDVTVGSVITHNATDGEKTIFIADIIGIQYKEPGLTLGYIQFETAASEMNNLKSNFFNENTFTYDGNEINEGVEKVKRYVLGRMSLLKELPTK